MEHAAHKRGKHNRAVLVPEFIIKVVSLVLHIYIFVRFV